jgi:hypothetical protein
LRPSKIIPLVRQAVGFGADIIKADPTDDMTKRSLSRFDRLNALRLVAPSPLRRPRHLGFQKLLDNSAHHRAQKIAISGHGSILSSVLFSLPTAYHDLFFLLNLQDTILWQLARPLGEEPSMAPFNTF